MGDLLLLPDDLFLQVAFLLDLIRQNDAIHSQRGEHIAYVKKRYYIDEQIYSKRNCHRHLGDDKAEKDFAGQPHPAPLMDAYTALEYVYDHADEFKIDKDHIILAGESGGVGLAACLALYTKDQGKIHPVGEFLIYPQLDCMTGSIILRRLQRLRSLRVCLTRRSL